MDSPIKQLHEYIMQYAASVSLLTITVSNQEYKMHPENSKWISTSEEDNVYVQFFFFNLQLFS